jgi:hypothetical protein
MAVVNVKSPLISNYDAQPRILSSGYLAGANDIVQCGVIACGATDSAASVYRVGWLPSGARIEDIQIQNDANTGGTSYKLGVLFSTNDGGGTVVTFSDQIFASAITMASARNVWTSIYNPSILSAGGLPVNCALRVWELLGLAADPYKEYHLAWTAVAPGSAGGNIATQLTYVK